MKLQDAAILVLHILWDKSREEAGTKNDRDMYPGHSFLLRLCLYRHQLVGLERAVMKRR